MDDLDDLSTLEVFRLEAADHLRNLQKDAVGAGGVPPGAESMARMMRDLHTLKGAARLVEMRAVQALAHAMESVLEAATRAGRPLTKSAVDLFLESLDLLGTMVSRDEAPAPELPAAVARLEAAALALASEAPAEPPEPTGSSAPSSTPHVLPTLDQFAVRVPVERLDRMMALAGELHIVRQRLQRVFRQLQGLGKPIGQIDGDWRAASALYADGTELARARLETLLRGNSRGSGVLRKEFDGDLDGFDEMLGQLERLHQDLGEQIMQARMLPLDYLVEPYPRLVRDLAAQLGKDVRFASEGAGTRVDRDVLEGLREPLLHLIQNAVDHGAESPAERRASGKPPQASILLSARYLGDRLVVEVADDGRGVHVEEVRRLGVERGVVPPGRASRMTRAELLGLLFKRGFSTAAKLTDLSGRGVGLDAVKSAVEKLRGDIELVSTEGAGTRIAIRLPLSVAVTRVLLAKAGSVLWAFPVDHVERLLLVSASDIREGPDGRALALADETPRLVMLNEQLSSGSMTHTVIEEQHVVVLSEGGVRVAVTVDRFVEEEDVIVKPLDPRLGKVRCVLGAAVTRAGEVALVMDVSELVARVDDLNEGLVREPAPAAQRGRCRVLVVEDSRTTREVNRRLLAGAGYEVVTAADGLEALDQLAARGFDLVLTDATMPGLDGFGLARRIKTDPRLAALPVVMLTFKDRDEDRKRAEAAGIDEYLVKEQAGGREILQVLARALASRARPRAAAKNTSGAAERERRE